MYRSDYDNDHVNDGVQRFCTCYHFCDGVLQGIVTAVCVVILSTDIVTAASVENGGSLSQRLRSRTAGHLMRPDAGEGDVDRVLPHDPQDGGGADHDAEGSRLPVAVCARAGDWWWVARAAGELELELHRHAHIIATVSRHRF